MTALARLYTVLTETFKDIALLAIGGSMFNVCLIMKLLHLSQSQARKAHLMVCQKSVGLFV